MVHRWICEVYEEDMSADFEVGTLEVGGGWWTSTHEPLGVLRYLEFGGLRVGELFFP